MLIGACNPNGVPDSRLLVWALFAGFRPSRHDATSFMSIPVVSRGAATSKLSKFLAEFRSTPRRSRRVMWDTWSPCLSDADWCLRSDGVPDSRCLGNPPAPGAPGRPDRTMTSTSFPPTFLMLWSVARCSTSRADRHTFGVWCVQIGAHPLQARPQPARCAYVPVCPTPIPTRSTPPTPTLLHVRSDPDRRDVLDPVPQRRQLCRPGGLLHPGPVEPRCHPVRLHDKSIHPTFPTFLVSLRLFFWAAWTMSALMSLQTVIFTRRVEDSSSKRLA